MLGTLLIRSSDGSGLLLWAVVGLCAGLYLFAHGFVLLRRRRLILDTPFSRVRSASLGMVELSGLAVGPYTMPAPITGMPCYYHRTLVWEWKQQGKNKAWVKVAGECRHLPFFLDDNTGRVLVDPRGADLDIHLDFHQQFCDSFFTTKDPAPDSVRSFLARHGIETRNKIKVEEYCIKPKNALFILGTLAENPGLEVTAEPAREEVNLGSTHTYTFKMNSSFSVSSGVGTRMLESFSARLAQQGNLPLDNTKPQVVRISITTGSTKSADMSQQEKIANALLKAGITNPAAWAAAQVEMPGAKVSLDTSAVVKPAAEVSSSLLTPNGFDTHPPVVLMKGTNNKTFLISWQSQQNLARALGWKCALMIWGGPALALLSLYVLLGIANLL